MPRRIRSQNRKNSGKIGGIRKIEDKKKERTENDDNPAEGY